jgi:protein SCO1/2
MKRILAFSLITITAVLIAYFSTKDKQKPLPVINPIDVNSEMVDEDLLRKGYGHTVGNFAFTNQEGNTITQQEIEDKIVVVEYFFTTCMTICPKMNVQMQRINEHFKGNEEFKILSFTVNPEVDTVEQMKRYADAHKANSNQWHFLTGEKEKLYQLARTSFFVLKPAEAQNLGDAGNDFIHTNNFVLIDRKKRLRGYYDGTSVKETNQLIQDIEQLMTEK